MLKQAWSTPHTSSSSPFLTRPGVLSVIHYTSFPRKPLQWAVPALPCPWFLLWVSGTEWDKNLIPTRASLTYWFPANSSSAAIRMTLNELGLPDSVFICKVKIRIVNKVLNFAIGVFPSPSIYWASTMIWVGTNQRKIPALVKLTLGKGSITVDTCNKQNLFLARECQQVAFLEIKGNKLWHSNVYRSCETWGIDSSSSGWESQGQRRWYLKVPGTWPSECVFHQCP